MSKLEAYVRARLQNKNVGHREASRLAEYSGGASQAAVEAYRFARIAKDEPQAAEWLSEELARVEAEIARKAREASMLRAKLRAVRVVTRF